MEFKNKFMKHFYNKYPLLDPLNSLGQFYDMEASTPALQNGK